MLRFQGIIFIGNLWNLTNILTSFGDFPFHSHMAAGTAMVQYDPTSDHNIMVRSECLAQLDQSIHPQGWSLPNGWHYKILTSGSISYYTLCHVELRNENGRTTEKEKSMKLTQREGERINGEIPNSGQITGYNCFWIPATFQSTGLMRCQGPHRFYILISLLQNGLELFTSKNLNKCCWKHFCINVKPIIILLNYIILG